jgi:hypothetical protein
VPLNTRQEGLGVEHLPMNRHCNKMNIVEASKDVWL